jgi:hypothetical protein
MIELIKLISFGTLCKKLRKENLLSQLEIEKDIADMIGSLKSTWESHLYLVLYDRIR